MATPLDDPPSLPWDLQYLWAWWVELHFARSSGGFGLGGITYQSIEAWKHVTGADPNVWEVGAIKAIDNAYCGVINAQKPKATNGLKK